MTGHDSTTIDCDEHGNEVDRIIAAYLQQVDAGEKPDRQALLKEHPQFDTELREFFNDLEIFTAPSNTSSHFPTGKPGTISDSKLPKLRYFGEYELIREIARGGMGVVYEARQKSLKRTVAVKMILGGVLASDEDVQRFRTEAQAAAGLQHPNIVSIHEVGVCQDQHYFSMDLVNGSNLADMVKDGVLHHDESVLCIQKLAEAVHYAHARGTLHRDLKPSNILIDELGTPHITDFGLAKLMHDESGLTATGARLGTPSYMPPEQAAGEGESVGPAGDIYSLGCILYELLTGRPPFRGSSVIQTLNMVVNQLPVSPRDLNAEIPKDLANICLKCLQKLPADRYESAGDLAEDLVRFSKGEPVSAHPIGPIERCRRRLRKHRRAFTALVSTIAVAAFGTFVHQKYETYEQNRRAIISFTTPGSPLVTEVRDHLDRKQLLNFTTPTSTPVSLEPGDLRIRFSEPYQLSEEFRLHTTKALKRTIPVEVEDRHVFKPLSTTRKPYIVTLTDHADIIVADKQCIERFDGKTSQSVWKIDPTADEVLTQMGVEWISWIGYHQKDPVDRHSLLTSTPDLNGDGIGDLVWLSGNTRGTSEVHPPGIITQSGADGRFIWTHRLPVSDSNSRSRSFKLRIAGQPETALIDEDATPDLIVTSTGELRHVEAISGRTGQRLWKFQIEPEQFEGPFHWAKGAKPDNIVADFLSAGQLEINGESNIVVATGRSLVRLDEKSGRKLGSLYTSDWPIAESIIADLNGDGQDEVLLRHQSKSGKATLTAIDPASSNILWQHESTEISSTEVVDLDHQGPPEVIIAFTGIMQHTGPQRIGKMCRTLNGETGEVVWSGPSVLDGFDKSMFRVKSVSDLNRDGVADVVMARARFLTNANMYYHGETIPGVRGLSMGVHALSGRDGSELWINTVFDGNADSNTHIHDLHEWTQGSDGRPLIVVSVATKHRSGLDRASTWVLQGSGHGIGFGIHQPTRSITKAEEVQIADFNGDGHLDLYWIDQLQGINSHGPWNLHTIAGSAPVMWRRLGLWRPYVDFNGDGIIDLLDTSSERPPGTPGLRAASGFNGRILWENKEQFTAAFPLQSPDGDIDGDGCSDIITFLKYGKYVIRRAISGKTGDSIWMNEEKFTPGSPFGSTSRIDFESATAIDVDNDGLSEVVVVTKGIDSSDVLVLNANSGEIKWHTERYRGKVWPHGRGKVWPLDRTNFQTEGTSSITIIREEEQNKLQRKRIVRQDEMKLTLETLDGSSGKRIEKRLVTKHDFPQIKPSGVSALTWHDRPHPRTEKMTAPIAVRFNGRPALCFTQDQTLMIIDSHDRQLGALSIPDRLFWHRSRKTELSALDIDGDDSDELIVTTWISNPDAQPHLNLQQAILALKIHTHEKSLALTILWEWKMPFGFGDVMAIDQPDSAPSNITACSGNTVFNIDARTGQVCWTCNGPKWWLDDKHGIPENLLQYEACRPVILQTATPDQPARVLFRRDTRAEAIYAVDCRFSVSAN